MCTEFSRFCPGSFTEEQALKAAVATWPPGVRPVVHWSESQEGRKAHAHSDFIDVRHIVQHRCRWWSCAGISRCAFWAVDAQCNSNHCQTRNAYLVNLAVLCCYMETYLAMHIWKSPAYYSRGG